MQVSLQIKLIPRSREESFPVVQLLIIVDMHTRQELALSLATEVVADLLRHCRAGVGWRAGLWGATHLAEGKVKSWNECVQTGQDWRLRNVAGTWSGHSLKC